MRRLSIQTRPAITLLLACALLLLPISDSASAQNPAQFSATKASFVDKPAKGDQRIKIDVNMVLVSVTVTDPYNRLVTGLEQENFKVFEDKLEQEVIHFSSEDVPISIGVVFDMSGSMSNKVDKARLAALQFFKTANPQDEFLLVTFNDRAQLVSRFTTSMEELQTRMMYTNAHGRTALLDAIYLALSEMKNARNSKRAILIISDGGDNHSRYNESDIRSFVKESDVQLYGVGIFEPATMRGGAAEIANGPTLLNDLTEMTGGRLFTVENLNDLPDIAAKIGMELRNQYVVGYRPANKDRDGKWRKIKVKLQKTKGLPPLNVYARAGYYAPQH